MTQVSKHLEMETYTYLYYILTTIVIYLLTTFFLRKLRKYPPMPWPCLPIIGHLYILKEPIQQTFANLAHRYGPVVSIRLGSRPVLLVLSPVAAEECLSKNDIIFCNRQSAFLIGKYLGYNYTSPTWAPYGTHWTNLRKIKAVELLSTQRLQTLAGIRANEVKRLIRQICQLINPSINNGSNDNVVKMKPLLYDMVMNILTIMIFGKRYYGVEGDGETERFREVVEGTTRAFNLICIGDLVPYLRCLDWKKEREMKEFKEFREVVMKDLLDGQKYEIKMEKNKVIKPFIQVLLELQEKQPEYYTDDIILGITLDLFVGGSDTTVATLEWILSAFLNHPEVITKAQTEIDNKIGSERLLEETDLAHLPYLRSVINETFRMYPAAPLLVPHESSKDCVVQGYNIPSGTMLMVNIWAIHNDPNVWDEPTRFNPDRFNEVDGHKVGYKLMPFGSGRRSCPGEGMAVRVLGLCIGSLIQCFEWNRVDEKLVDMRKANGFDLKKGQPLEARLKPRPNMIKVLAQL